MGGTELIKQHLLMGQFDEIFGILSIQYTYKKFLIWSTQMEVIFKVTSPEKKGHENLLETI
jgi:hypothetical protein